MKTQVGFTKSVSIKRFDRYFIEESLKNLAQTYVKRNQESEISRFVNITKLTVINEFIQELPYWRGKPTKLISVIIKRNYGDCPHLKRLQQIYVSFVATLNLNSKATLTFTVSLNPITGIPDNLNTYRVTCFSPGHERADVWSLFRDHKNFYFLEITKEHRSINRAIVYHTFNCFILFNVYGDLDNSTVSQIFKSSVGSNYVCERISLLNSGNNSLDLLWINLGEGYLIYSHEDNKRNDFVENCLSFGFDFDIDTETYRFKCAHCGEYEKISDGVVEDDLFYCTDCADDLVFCEDIGRYLHEDDAIYIAYREEFVSDDSHLEYDRNFGYYDPNDIDTFLTWIYNTYVRR